MFEFNIGNGECSGKRQCENLIKSKTIKYWRGYASASAHLIGMGFHFYYVIQSLGVRECTCGVVCTLIVFILLPLSL